MVFKDKVITAKDGRRLILRSPTGEDSAQMVEYLRRCSEETDFLIRYPEECTEDDKAEKDFIENTLDSDDSVMIGCFDGEKVVGNCSLSFFGRIKTRHRASLGIAILKDYWGLGIGSAMFEEIIRISREHGTEQLELEYLEGNDRGRALYDKFVFSLVAEHPNAVKLKDGRYLSEYLMIKKL